MYNAQSTATTIQISSRLQDGRRRDVYFCGVEYISRFSVRMIDECKLYTVYCILYTVCTVYSVYGRCKLYIHTDMYVCLPLFYIGKCC